MQPRHRPRGGEQQRTEHERGEDGLRFVRHPEPAHDCDGPAGEDAARQRNEVSRDEAAVVRFDDQDDPRCREQEEGPEAAVRMLPVAQGREDGAEQREGVGEEGCLGQRGVLDAEEEAGDGEGTEDPPQHELFPVDRSKAFPPAAKQSPGEEQPAPRRG